jgi:uncharacterized SAM-binding protein YcdF (DUF218 family)
MPRQPGVVIARLARWLGAAAVLIFAIAAFSPLANWLNAWMAGRPEIEPAEAIVVMGRGGADADGVLTNRSLRRTLHGIGLYRRGLAPLLVFSGGLDETGARADLARGFAVPPAGILTAPGARTTREEAALLARTLQARGVRRILLVADPIDMPRTRDFLARAGFTVLSAPTASSGPGNPESRLGLTRDIAIELAAWIYSRLTPVG